MRKHRWFALLLAGMMAVLVAVPGWNLAAAKAEATAELPVWQQPFEETVTLDVVIGWDADPVHQGGYHPRDQCPADRGQGPVQHRTEFPVDGPQ